MADSMAYRTDMGCLITRPAVCRPPGPPQRAAGSWKQKNRTEAEKNKTEAEKNEWVKVLELAPDYLFPEINKEVENGEE